MRINGRHTPGGTNQSGCTTPWGYVKENSESANGESDRFSRLRNWFFPPMASEKPPWRMLPGRRNLAGTLYLYFNSKEELYASLTFGFLRRFISRLKHIDTGSEAEPLQIIKGLLDAMVDVYEMDPAMLIHLVHLQSSETLYDMPVHLKSEFKELFRSSREAIAKVVHKAMSIGRVRAANPLILADILWALFSGVILREESKRFINGSTRYLRQHLDIAFEIFTRGLELQER